MGAKTGAEPSLKIIFRLAIYQEKVGDKVVNLHIDDDRGPEAHEEVKEEAGEADQQQKVVEERYRVVVYAEFAHLHKFFLLKAMHVWTVEEILTSLE